MSAGRAINQVKCMDYLTILDAAVRIWHPTLTTVDLETRFGRTATVSHNAGDRRLKGDQSKYQESYCEFQVSDAGPQTLAKAVGDCAKALHTAFGGDPAFAATGGRCAIIVGIFRSDFVQLDLNIPEVRELREANAHLVLENRS